MNDDTTRQEGQEPVETTVEAPVSTPAPEAAPETPVVSSISERLSGEGQGDSNVGEESGARAETPVPFDFTKLRPEDLQALKQMLNATPDRVAQKRANPIIMLRKMEQGIIVDFGEARLTMQRDEFTNITKEVFFIPVKFLGATDFVQVDWKDFMAADQIKCEVISTKNVPGRIGEGEVVLQKETGRYVEMEITTLDTWFTVKLPEGSTPETIEIEAHIANA